MRLGLGQLSSAFWTFPFSKCVWTISIHWIIYSGSLRLQVDHPIVYSDMPTETPPMSMVPCVVFVFFLFFP
jgi:hypothetical protein